jgi:hypothetical protein
MSSGAMSDIHSPHEPGRMDGKAADARSLLNRRLISAPPCVDDPTC